MNRWGRWRAPIALATGLAVWAAFAASIDAGHAGVVHDDGIYLTAARALRDGLPYGLPNRPSFPPPKYPIGLPLVVAGALRVVPGTTSLAAEIAVARAVVIGGGLAFFTAAYGWLRRGHVAAGNALLIVLATAFSHAALIGGAATVFADLPFGAVAYTLLARWANRQRTAPASHALGDGVLAGLALLLRGNGVTLVAAAVVAACLSRKRWAGLGACAVGIALVVVPASLYPRRPPHAVPSGSYGVELRAGWSSPEAGLRIVAGNVATAVRDLATHVVFPNASYNPAVARVCTVVPTLAWGMRLLLGGAVLAGAATLWRRCRRRDWPAWCHVVATLLLYAVWPWDTVMDRLLLPLFPMILLALRVGLSGAWRIAGAGGGLARRAGTIALSLALVSNVSVTARSVTGFHAGGRQWPGASNRNELGQTLRHLASLEPDAVIAATWPETVSLYTGRQAVPLIEDDQLMLRASGDARRLKRWIALCGGRPCYLLVRGPAEDRSATDARQAADLAADPAYGLREVYSSANGRYRVLRITRSR